MIKALLEKLFSGESLCLTEAKAALGEITSGRPPAAQIAAFLTVYRMRPLTVEELQGFREAALELAVPVTVPYLHTVDLCGTGGDGKNSFNVSTIAALVVAASMADNERAYVVKHGNYSVSSRCGSSNLLEALGVYLPKDQQGVQQSLEETGIAFLHAPYFHPAMKQVAPIRKELGVRTFFNILGPLINPAQPSAQLMGVYNRSLAELYRELLKQGKSKFTIVHSTDGFDEISLTAPALVYTAKGMREIAPADMRLGHYQVEDLSGGDSPEESAKIALSILNGQGTPAQQEVVLANAAFALQTLKQHLPFENCFEAAREALESLAAMSVVTKLRRLAA